MNIRKILFAVLLIGSVAIPYALQSAMDIESAESVRAERNKKIIERKKAKKAEQLKNKKTGKKSTYSTKRRYNKNK